MKFINTDHQAGNDHWELRDGDNQPVEIGRIVESSRRHLNPEEDQRSFQLEGGTCPQRPSSSGKVHGFWVEDRASGNPVTNGEYYPQVFGLEWHQVSKPETKPETEPESPSGQLIGVIITAMINDGIKQGIDAAMAAQRDELKTLVAATLTDLVDEMEKTAFDADDHADDIRDVVLDSFEIDDHFDITNYRDEIEEMAKESLGDVEDNVKAALNDLIDSGKLALTLSNY